MLCSVCAQFVAWDAWDKGRTLFICMLDLTKAFDSVDRSMAWQILLSRGAPSKLVALIKDLHTDHSASICSEGNSAPVGTEAGFKQGCVLAPALFIFILDTVVKQLLPQLRQLGVTICYKFDGQLMRRGKLSEEELMWLLLMTALLSVMMHDHVANPDILKICSTQWRTSFKAKGSGS